MSETTATIIVSVLASSGVWAVVNAVIGYVLDKKRKRDASASINPEEIELHGKALRGLLYGELERRCSDYIRRGSITAAELNDLRTYYYEPYHALHGDGTIDRLISRVENLDIKDKED